MRNKQNSGSAMVGIIIVILILILGGVYFYRTSLKDRIQPATNTATETADDVSDLESDLGGIDVDSLDQGI